MFYPRLLLLCSVFIIILVSWSQALSCRTCSQQATGPQTDALIVAHFTDWKHYLMVPLGGLISIINGSLYTHLVMGVSSVSNGLCIIADGWASLQLSFTSTSLGSDVNDPYKGNLNQARRLKLAYPHLKTILEVTSSGGFSTAAADSANRAKLATSCVSLMQQYNLDGIQINWANPGTSDYNNFALLVASFRSAIQTSTYPNATLSISANFDPARWKSEYNIAAMAPYLDWINVRSFWYWGGSNSIVGHTANLFPAGPSSPHSRSVAQDLQSVLDLPMSSCKLLMGIPSFGSVWKLPSAPASLTLPSFYAVGASTGLEGGAEFSSYLDFDVQRLLSNGTWTTIWDSTAQASVYYNPSLLNFITYDSAESLNAKMQWVLDNNLAGVSIEDVTGDLRYNRISSTAVKKFESSRPYPKSRSSTKKFLITSSQQLFSVSKQGPISTSSRSQSQTSTTNSPSSTISSIQKTAKTSSSSQSSSMNILSSHSSSASSGSSKSMPSPVVATPSIVGFSAIALRSTSTRLAPVSPSQSSGSRSRSRFPTITDTSIGTSFNAWMVSLAILCDTRQYTDDRRQLEDAYLRSALSKSLNVDQTQFVNAQLVSSTQATTSVSFLVLPRSSLGVPEGDEISALFTSQMQETSSFLRQNSILGFALSPPTPISVSQVSVRRCGQDSYIIIRSNSDKCPTNTLATQSTSSKVTIIGVAGGIAFLGVLGVGLWLYRKPRLMGLEQPANVVYFNGMTQEDPDGHPLSLKDGAVILGPFTTSSYGSSDQAFTSYSIVQRTNTL